MPHMNSCTRLRRHEGNSRCGCDVRNNRWGQYPLTNDTILKVAVALLLISCAVIVTLVWLTTHAVASEVLVAWFYFATVDHIDVWGFGPFDTYDACLVHREMTIPVNVEATACALMNVVEEA